MMNHDATHCADWTPECPKLCYRAELTRELNRICYVLPVSWSHFKGTKECLPWPGGKRGIIK